MGRGAAWSGEPTAASMAVVRRFARLAGAGGWAQQPSSSAAPAGTAARATAAALPRLI